MSRSGLAARTKVFRGQFCRSNERQTAASVIFSKRGPSSSQVFHVAIPMLADWYSVDICVSENELTLEDLGLLLALTRIAAGSSEPVDRFVELALIREGLLVPGEKLALTLAGEARLLQLQQLDAEQSERSPGY